MIIKEKQVVTRVLLKFSAEETAWLRNVAFLPPEGNEEAELWLTYEEMEQLCDVTGLSMPSLPNT